MCSSDLRGVYWYLDVGSKVSAPGNTVPSVILSVTPGISGVVRACSSISPVMPNTADPTPRNADSPALAKPPAISLYVCKLRKGDKSFAGDVTMRFIVSGNETDANAPRRSSSSSPGM